MIIFAVGSTDRLFFRLGISYTAQIHFWRVGIWVLPVIIFAITLCLPLAAAQRRTRCVAGHGEVLPPASGAGLHGDHGSTPPGAAP